MKKAIVIILVVCLLIYVTGIFDAAKNMIIGINRQENTTWRSEDGTITIHIHKQNETPTGTMTVEGEQIEFNAFFDLMGFGIDIYPREEGKNFVDDSFERWDLRSKSKEKFVAVVKETTYFARGQRITFHRIDEPK